jgi:hypothetical protein
MLDGADVPGAWINRDSATLCAAGHRDNKPPDKNRAKDPGDNAGKPKHCS